VHLGLLFKTRALGSGGSVAGQTFPFPIAQIPETIRKEQWRRAMNFFYGEYK
jgi:hypothetical protein